MDNKSANLDLFETETATQDINTFDLENKKLEFLDYPFTFQEYMAEEEEKTPSKLSDNSCTDPVLKPLSGPFQLVQQLATSITPKQSISCSKAIEKSASVDTLILEKLSMLVTVHLQEGLEETSFIFDANNSILDGTEIVIKSYLSSVGSLNIEIKTCDKLQALIHKHQNELIHNLQKACPAIQIHRLDLSLKQDRYSSREKIAGTNLRKVTKAKMGSHDNQT
jgi:hypothetical protein